MELDLKPVSKTACNARFRGVGMNEHNMVENSYTVELAVKYRLLMLYSFFSYVLINYILSLIQTFTATKIECGRQVDRWDSDNVRFNIVSMVTPTQTQTQNGSELILCISVKLWWWCWHKRQVWIKHKIEWTQTNNWVDNKLINEIMEKLKSFVVVTGWERLIRTRLIQSST